MTTAVQPLEQSKKNELFLGPSPAGLKISGPLGVGLWSWGDRFTWGVGGYDKETSEETFKDAFSASLEAGVNFFDTAEMYGMGQSEIYLGKFAKEQGGKVIVATKYMPLPYRFFQPGSLLGALRASLKRLGLERVDLYQIHSPILSPRSLEVLADALAEAVKQGLVRAVGVSNYSELQMRRTHKALAVHGIPLATNQIEFSLCRRHPETSGLLAACKELGVTPLAYSPMAMGRLTGKYDANNKPKGSRRFGDVSWELLQPLNDALREIGQAHGGKTPPQVALNWVICKGAVPIPGAKNAQQARENAGALGWRLSPDEVSRLDTLGFVGGLKLGQSG